MPSVTYNTRGAEAQASPRGQVGRLGVGPVQGRTALGGQLGEKHTPASLSQHQFLLGLPWGLISSALS